MGFIQSLPYVESDAGLTRGVVVARVGLVKPDKARLVGNSLIQMAQQGRLFEKVRPQPS